MVASLPSHESGVLSEETGTRMEVGVDSVPWSSASLSMDMAMRVTPVTTVRLRGASGRSRSYHVEAGERGSTARSVCSECVIARLIDQRSNTRAPTLPNACFQQLGHVHKQRPTMTRQANMNIA